MVLDVITLGTLAFIIFLANDFICRVCRVYSNFIGLVYRKVLAYSDMYFKAGANIFENTVFRVR